MVRVVLKQVVVLEQQVMVNGTPLSGVGVRRATGAGPLLEVFGCRQHQPEEQEQGSLGETWDPPRGMAGGTHVTGPTNTVISIAVTQRLWRRHRCPGAGQTGMAVPVGREMSSLSTEMPHMKLQEMLAVTRGMAGGILSIMKSGTGRDAGRTICPAHRGL